MTDPETNELVGEYARPASVPVNESRDLYRINDEECFYMCCGSFLKGYEEDMPSYVEDMGLEATELGWGEIEVKNDCLVSVDVRKVD